MSKRLSDLCAVLVEHAHGALAAHIFSTLAQTGRLTFHDLLVRTRTKPVVLNSTLSRLAQHSILLHHAEDEWAPTFYSVDWHAAYGLVRAQKVAVMVQRREGDAACELVTELLKRGRMNVGELVELHDLTPGSKRDSGIDTGEDCKTRHELPNGVAKDIKPNGKILNVSRLHELVVDLLKKGIIVKVTARSHTSESDLYEQRKSALIAEKFTDGKITGPKKAQQFNLAMNDLKRKWQDEEEFSERFDLASRGVIKQPKGSSPSKRRKTEKGLPNGVHDDDEEDEEEDCGLEEGPRYRLPHDMVVRVNLTKCMKMMRTERLVEMARDHLGSSTARVYSALLRAVENQDKGVPQSDTLDEDDEDEADEYNNINDDSDNEREEKNVKEQPEDPPVLLSVDDTEVLGYLDDKTNLTDGIRGAGNLRYFVEQDEDIIATGIKQEPVSDDEDEDEPVGDGIRSAKKRTRQLYLLDIHLQILAEHPKRFCIRNATASKSKINFASLAKNLIQTEIDTMINTRCGKLCTRMIRILRQRGKHDDAHMAKLSIVSIKDARTQLSQMQRLGFVDIQELPSDNKRQPSNTTYLWSLEEDNIRELFLQQTYQGMTRALQRLQVERKEFIGVIEKADREGVKGREDDVLNQAEIAALRKWREIEGMLLSQVFRMDGVVALLRDYSGLDASLYT